MVLKMLFYKKFICIALFFSFSLVLFGHEKSDSRADLFKNELRADDELLQKISEIDNKYRIQYQKLNAEIRFHNTELNEVVQTKPFDEPKAKKILAKLSDSQSLIKLYSIKHHLAIEENLDSFQRMKFNELFNP